jgi:hypothetical protein
MSRKSTFRKLIFIPLTIAAFLLCTGSLINFHQNRIWHKPLLPELVADKRDSEKILKNLSQTFTSHPAQVPFILYNAICSPKFDLLASSESAFQTRILSFPVPAISPGSFSLRGPPQV